MCVCVDWLSVSIAKNRFHLSQFIWFRRPAPENISPQCCQILNTVSVVNICALSMWLDLCMHARGVSYFQQALAEPRNHLNPALGIHYHISMSYI